MDTTERSVALFGTWKRVNELAEMEDMAGIRHLLAEAGIEPGMHVGTDPEAFTDDMTAEWVLGQWAETIDANALWALNSARNISLHQYDKVMAKRSESVDSQDGDHNVT
jgi:hypothetical protein